MNTLTRYWLAVALLLCVGGLRAQLENLPDNIIPLNCAIEVESMTWGVTNAWSSPTVVSNLNIPLVGDLDGDGHPEIVCFSLAGQSHYVNDGYTGNVGFELLVYDGVTHALKATVTMESPVSEYDAAAYGLVRTSDDKGLIVVACYDNRLRAYDITSATPNTPYWVSDATYASGTSNYAVNVSFADFNGDGHPEVYVRNKVYNAENGHLLAEAATTNTGSSYAHYTQFTHRKLSSPFAANVCGDSRPELILGNEIYEVSITNLNGTAGNTLARVQQVTPPGGAPADGNVQVADFNMDGFLDVFISIRNTDAQSGTVYCYVWDVHNGELGNPLIINTNRSGKSIPLIADIDNDGMLEMVLQCGASSGRQIQAYKYNTATQSFSLMWDMIPDEDTFSNSFTAFDFNQDGILELVICDQSTLKIVNGSGHSHLTHNDTLPVYVLNTFPYTETTIMQYPVIADVDNDGSADLVSVGSSMLNIFKSSGQPWAPARPVWNQYLYNVTNINRDLTVPSPLFNNGTTFTDPDNIVRRPFNNFLQQATTLDQYGRPYFPGDYAEYEYNDSICMGDSYTDENFNISSDTLSAGVHEFQRAFETGTECDSVITLHLTVLTQSISDIYDTICHGQSYHQYGFDIPESMTIGGNELTETLNLTSLAGCDSVVTLHLAVLMLPTSEILDTICHGQSYHRHGFNISENSTIDGDELTETLHLTDHYGCDSTVTLHLTLVDGLLSILPPFENFCENYSTVLSVETSFSHLRWSTGEVTQEIVVNHPGTYTVEATDGSCSASDAITIEACDFNLFLPNAITPSKDEGTNDYFFIPDYIAQQLEEFEIHIYDRWGRLVFHSNSPYFRWDGKEKGKLFLNNVYTYVIRGKAAGNPRFVRTGSIVVL
ncbi:MAG: gliding motility-associated C-terminal domain-containing protein [Bacteroidales bacterium]|nr:gliding motility-associated C-terminal domain-containing protein [Bacteroidales bacterium]